MHVPIQTDDMVALRILTRPAENNPNTITLFSNRSLWLSPQLMQTMHGIVNAFITKASSLAMRNKLDGELMRCLYANQQHISLSAVPGWLNLGAHPDPKLFARMWEASKGDDTDATPRQTL